MPRVRHGVCVLALTALVAAGCGGAEPGGTRAPAPPAAPSGTAASVPESLMFQARTVDGGQLDAATLAGVPVAFWFWAAWCPHCADAASEIKAIQSEYAGAAHIVGVAGLASGEDSMRNFVTEHELDGFPHLADDEGSVWRRFGVTMQDYYVLLDPSGNVAHEGRVDTQQLRDQISTLAG